MARPRSGGRGGSAGRCETWTPGAPAGPVERLGLAHDPPLVLPPGPTWAPSSFRHLRIRISRVVHRASIGAADNESAMVLLIGEFPSPPSQLNEPTVRSASPEVATEGRANIS